MAVHAAPRTRVPSVLPPIIKVLSGDEWSQRTTDGAEEYQNDHTERSGADCSAGPQPAVEITAMLSRQYCCSAVGSPHLSAPGLLHMRLTPRSCLHSSLLSRTWTWWQPNLKEGQSFCSQPSQLGMALKRYLDPQISF
jgi:hypothetical protein